MTGQHQPLEDHSEEIQSETWPEFIEHELHHIEDQTGVSIGSFVIVVTAIVLGLKLMEQVTKLIAVWKGK